MSAETSKWLNTMTLIGNVLKRGHAWHWRATEQGEEPNHYDGFIPKEDVERRLFNFTAISEPVFTKTLDGTFREVEGKQAIVHSKTKDVFGVLSNRYQIHQFNDALLSNLEQIIDSSELGIDSAGLLKGGARAWVQISVPENLHDRWLRIPSDASGDHQSRRHVADHLHEGLSGSRVRQHVANGTQRELDQGALPSLRLEPQWHRKRA